MAGALLLAASSAVAAPRARIITVDCAVATLVHPNMDPQHGIPIFFATADMAKLVSLHDVERKKFRLSCADVRLFASRLFDRGWRERGIEPIPGSHEGRGRTLYGPITAAILTGPMQDYAPRVFGDRPAARALAVREWRYCGPNVQICEDTLGTVEAGEGAAFVDLRVRTLRIPSGGDEPHFLIVKSYRDRGSALAIVGKRDGAWQVVAETPPTGDPKTWLNPAVIADFDGDGISDIAVVRDPHGEGLLQVWTWRGDDLVLKFEKAGFSNHVPGSVATELAKPLYRTVHDTPTLAIPTKDRKAVAILSLKDDIREVRRVPLPKRAATGVASYGDFVLVVGLEDGTIAYVKLRRVIS